MKRPWEVSRRALLRGTGVGIGLPLLEAMLPGLKGAHAAGATPQRMVFFVFEGGTPECPDPARGIRCFTPKTAGTNFETTPLLKPLVDMGLRNDILVLSNMHNSIARQHKATSPDYEIYKALDHNRAPAALLTGVDPKYADGPNTVAGISADQVAANFFKTTTPRLPSLYVSNPFHVGSATVQQLSWSSATTRVPPVFKPTEVFKRIFGDGTGNSAALTRSLAYRKSILHSAKGDIDRLMGKLGKDDKAVMDEYLTDISDLETKLSAVVTCEGGPLPVDPVVDHGSYYQYDVDLRLHSQIMSGLIAKAFACDVTRVVVMHLKTHKLNPFVLDPDLAAQQFTIPGKDGQPVTMKLADFKSEFTLWHNDIEHAENGGQFGMAGSSPVGSKGSTAMRMFMYQAGCAALFKQFGYLVKKLKETPEGGGNVLDNSILACTSELSFGNGHSLNKLPLVVAGKGGGAVKPGRHIALQSETPIANLWLTMMKAAGVKKDGAELTKFGNSSGAVTLNV